MRLLLRSLFHIGLLVYVHGDDVGLRLVLSTTVTCPSVKLVKLWEERCSFTQCVSCRKRHDSTVLTSSTYCSIPCVCVCVSVWLCTREVCVYACVHVCNESLCVCMRLDGCMHVWCARAPGLCTESVLAFSMLSTMDLKVWCLKTSVFIPHKSVCMYNYVCKRLYVCICTCTVCMYVNKT